MFIPRLLLFQSTNTRSQRGEKEKNPPSESEANEENENDLSLMDRTRKMRQAKENAKKKARFQQVAEDEAAQLDQLVADAREKVEATKAARLRAAESRRVLEQLQAELQDGEPDPESSEEDTQFVSKTEIGAIVANSIKSVVSVTLLINYIYHSTVITYNSHIIINKLL